MATIINFVNKTERDILTETVTAKVFEYEISEPDLYRIAENQPVDGSPD